MANPNLPSIFLKDKLKVHPKSRPATMFRHSREKEEIVFKVRDLAPPGEATVAVARAPGSRP